MFFCLAQKYSIETLLLNFNKRYLKLSCCHEIILVIYKIYTNNKY